MQRIRNLMAYTGFFQILEYWKVMVSTITGAYCYQSFQCLSSILLWPKYVLPLLMTTLDNHFSEIFMWDLRDSWIFPCVTKKIHLSLSKRSLEQILRHTWFTFNSKEISKYLNMFNCSKHTIYEYSVTMFDYVLC